MDQTQKVVTLVFGGSDVAIPLIAEPGIAGELVYKLHIPSIEKRFSLKYVELDGLLAVADSRGLTFTGYAPNARIHVAGEPLEAPPPGYLTDVEVVRQPLPSMPYRNASGSNASGSAGTSEYPHHPELVYEWDIEPGHGPLDTVITQFTGSIPGKGRYPPPEAGLMVYLSTETGPLILFSGQVLERVIRLLQRDDNPLVQGGGNSSSSSSSGSNSTRRFTWTPHQTRARLDAQESQELEDSQDMSTHIPHSGEGVPEFNLIDCRSLQKYATIEVKKPEVLEGVEDMVTLWNIYAGEAPPDPAPAGANKANSVGRVISQAFMYMSTRGHVYGYITTYKRTWLLRCIQDNILCVSRCFKYDDTNPSTAEAVCWLTHMALQEGGRRAPWRACSFPGRPRAERLTRASSNDEGGGGPQQQQQQQQEAGKACRSAGPGRNDNSKSSQRGQQQASAGGTSYQKPSSSKQTRMDVQESTDQNASAHKGILLPDGLQISLSSILGTGICGPVYKGWWRGTGGVTVVAVKGATAPHLQQLLRQEVEVYQQLQELQGTSIPKLLAHGPGLNGIGYFLVLQFLPGTALFPSTHGEQPPIRDAAAAALGAVHACGVLHGDVRADNFIVQPGGQVWVIDFTHAMVGSPRDMQLGVMQAAEQHDLSVLLSCRQMQ